MSKKTIIFFSLLLNVIICFSCAAQSHKISLVKVTNNEELKYVLTYLQPSEIIRYSDPKKHFFIKALKLRGKSFILLDMEERIQKEFFYFLVSSFDEVTHINARLFKTKDLVNPVITKITESQDGKQFLIYLSFFDPQKTNLQVSKSDTISINEEDFARNRDIVFRIDKY